MTDRQTRVLVGLCDQPVVNEGVTRNLAHGIEHSRVQAGVLSQPLDQAPANAIGVEPQTGCGSRLAAVSRDESAWFTHHAFKAQRKPPLRRLTLTHGAGAAVSLERHSSSVTCSVRSICKGVTETRPWAVA